MDKIDRGSLPWAVEVLADHLIAGGVTVIVKEEKPQTDLTGKCGDCDYAVPEYSANGRVNSFVRCTNPAHIAKYCSRRDVSLRERSVKACKKYKPKESVEDGKG